MSAHFVRTFAVIFVACACTGTSEGGAGAPATSGGTGGAPINGGQGGGGGTSGSGGSMMAGVGGGGGSSSGGAGGSGGSGGSGGFEMPSGGQSGGVGGMGGTGGAAPMIDAGPMLDPATPSTGCSDNDGRPADGLVSVAGSYYFRFPASYDGTQPLPVLVGFHGCASVNRGTNAEDTEWMRLTESSAFADEYVRAVPVSNDEGGCWSYDNDIERVRAMYDELLASHCVDTSRVFATGHSSGAQFVVQVLLASHEADAQHLSFRGVAPVAASDYGVMTGPIPVMYIQGMMDAERGHGDGHETVERFRAANGCGGSSMPYAEVAGCQSDGTSVEPGCVIYDDCEAPTIWCSHNDPAYNGTMHGVPCFGVSAMHEFFESL